MPRVIAILLIGSVLAGCSLIVDYKDPPSGTCGDGVRQAWESCDGTDLGGATCSSLGFTEGVLQCDMDCRFVHDWCGALVCGNGVREEQEECDGNDFGDDSCENRGSTRAHWPRWLTVNASAARTPHQRAAATAWAATATPPSACSAR